MVKHWPESENDSKSIGQESLLSKSEYTDEYTAGSLSMTVPSFTSTHGKFGYTQDKFNGLWGVRWNLNYKLIDRVFTRILHES